MPASTELIRNIGIVAHIDAGKTTTTERILYYAGASHRMGQVDEGTTQTDFDPEEAKRGITIYSAAVTCHWKDCTINIIDTPGHVDFTAEVQRSLRVLDGAVVVFSAVEGVEAQSETVWRQADEFQVPRLCFINKMDRIGADFDRTLGQVRDRLKGNPVVLTIPIGAGHDFKGIVDLLQMKALYFDRETMGREIEVTDIPEDMQETAATWRSRLLDAVSMLDDDIMTAYLEGEEISADEINRVLRAGTLARELQPTYCGSSLDYCGVQPVLDGVNNYLPSPLDVPPVEGINPKPKKGEDEHAIRKVDVDEPFAGLIFKIAADKHADMCFVRVYSGVLKSGSRALNPRTGRKELISQLWHIQAGHREKIETDAVEAGGIVGVIGPKDVVTGDTLCDQKQPIILESISFPETVISMAVEPDSSADRKKLEDALLQLAKQDPTFKAKVSDETGQTIISGMGELHLEVLRERLQRDFNLNVKVHKPRVSYRETVQKPVEAEGEFSRTTAGETQFARVRIRVEPFETERGVEVDSELTPGELPKEQIRIVLETIQEAAQSGGVVGYPLMKVRFTLVSIDFREGETTEEALRAATSHAVQNALSEADVALLEPVMKLEVVTPGEFLGNIQADLNTRHARILGSEPRGHLTSMAAEVPLARMFGYSTLVRSLSQGRASYSMEPLKYDLAPPSVLEEMFG
ncbi:elongation factor G [Maioricimonas sp. JC845]|uniref:elongation factor G n=1 Tax=Maioricimonas sp. JC845 TaxID=3232138 RepID=UPI003458CBFD